MCSLHQEMYMGYFASRQEEQYIDAKERLKADIRMLSRYKLFVSKLLSHVSMPASASEFISQIEHSEVSISELIKKVFEKTST